MVNKGITSKGKLNAGESIFLWTAVCDRRESPSINFFPTQVLCDFLVIKLIDVSILVLFSRDI